jgi:hypothetical protein
MNRGIAAARNNGFSSGSLDLGRTASYVLLASFWKLIAIHGVGVR